MAPRLSSPLLFAATVLATAPALGHAVEATLYGMVNKAVIAYGDGQDSDYGIVDNNWDPTRFGLALEHELDNGLTVSALLEAALQDNPSNGLTQDITPNSNRSPANVLGTLTSRMTRVGVAGRFGAVFAGRQDVATNDAYTHDLTAAGDVLHSNIASMGGGLVFRSKAGGVYTPETLNGQDLTPSLLALGNDGSLDGLPSVRYNTPDFAGFNGSVSFAQEGNIDATVRHNATYGSFEVDGAVGYKFINNNAADPVDTTDGTLFSSLSVQHASGLGATVAYTEQNLSRTSGPGISDPTGWYAKVGYSWDSFGIAADYSHYENPVAVATDNALNSFAIGAQWDITDGVMLGASYRRFSADVQNISNLQDIDVTMLGMKVTF